MRYPDPDDGSGTGLPAGAKPGLEAPIPGRDGPNSDAGAAFAANVRVSVSGSQSPAGPTAPTAASRPLAVGR
jgi:hypothetical protein